MKPILLTMSAFGSYGDLTEIDFERAGNGLFLITGDTGAGKTTIFDAISYALYGAASGFGRDGSMLRSQYAPENSETWVELLFEDKGLKYRIRRSPAYTRLGKRKNKDGEYTSTSVAAKASLILPDGTEMSGRIRDIDEKIREIVGVDRDQFSQISMIAQGEYIRLLHASSKDRKEIFSRIFHTGIYGRIQQKLRDEDRRLYVKLEENKTKCEEAIRQVIIPRTDDEDEFNDLNEKWNSLKERARTNGEGLIELLQILTQKSRQMEEEAGYLEEEAIRKLSDAQNCLDLVRKYHHITEEKKNLETQKKAAQEKQRIAAEAYERQKPEIEEQIRLMKEALPLYTKQDELLKYCEASEGKLEKLRKNLKKMQDELEICRSQDEILRIKEREAVEARASLAECRAARERMQQRQSDLLELIKCSKSVKKWEDSLSEQQKKLKEVMQTYQLAEQTYQKASRRLLAMQAGILAAELKDNEPCPVCGSMDHPHPCQLEGEPIREEQVEKLKKNRDKADNEQRTVARICQESKINLEHEKKRHIEISRKLYNDENHVGDDSEIQNYETDIPEKELENIAEKINKCSRSEKIYAARIAEEDSIRSRRESNEKKQKELEASLDQEREKINQAEGEYLTGKRELEELSKRLEWKNMQELQDELLKHKSSLETLAMEASISDKKAQETREKCREIEGTLFSITEQINDFFKKHDKYKEFENLCVDSSVKEIIPEFFTEEKIMQEINHWETEKTHRIKLHRESVSARTQNENAYSTLRVYLQERDKLDREKQQISELYQTADGKLSGSARIDFQTYVQRQYFRQMIKAANRRLRVMSRGSFELKCRELSELGKQGEVGLDLDVYSFVTDRVRDVKTLSGGESFLAALSMALGMADVIQNAAGNVKIDAMFIDEGFGSLDEESRTRAVQVLHELTGGRRLIGIISHVTELKEEMSHKLIVKKGNSGSSVHWEIDI